MCCFYTVAQQQNGDKMRIRKWLQRVALLLLATCLFTQTANADATATQNKCENKMVALTFDDGPHPGHTDQILDILAKYGVKATFFVIGENAEYYPAPLKRAFAEGHEIENHSFDHKTRNKGPVELSQSITKTADLIEELTGKRPTYFRPPEGNATPAVKTAILELKLKQVFWTIDAEDWTGKSPAGITKQVLSMADGNEVVLFHDYTCPGHNTIKALPAIIEGLTAKGYRFVRIDEYFNGVNHT